MSVVLAIVTVLVACMQGHVIGQKLSLTSAPMQDTIILSNGNKTTLRIAVSMNYGGVVFPAGPIYSEPLRIALSIIEKQQLLPGYNLQLDLFDDRCERQIPNLFVRKVAEPMNVDELVNRVPIFISSSCQNWIVGYLPQHFNMIGLSLLATNPIIYYKREMFESYYMMMPAQDFFFEALSRFIESNGWRQANYLSDAIDLNDRYDKMAVEECGKRNITLTATKLRYDISTTSGPTVNDMEVAVSQLEQMNPRIIILNTNFVAMLACVLHKHKLYGPNYVLLSLGITAFPPNTPARLRVPGCTEQMLFEVLQSVIFFGHAATSNVDENRVDSLGMSIKEFDSLMMERIERPDLSALWWYYRASYYDMLMHAVMALNKTETELTKQNQSLATWTMNSINFKERGVEIHALLKKSLENNTFRGLMADINGSRSWNALKGVAAFYQVQMIPDAKQLQREKQLTLAELLVKAPVATYDSSHAQPQMGFGPAKLIWRTKDGQAPRDSIRVIHLQIPLISNISSIILIVLSTCLIIVAIVALALTVWKSPTNSMPTLNGLVIIGNIFMLSFILIVAPVSVFSISVQINCMFASLFLVTGFAAMFIPLVVKMTVAGIVWEQLVTIKGANSRNRRKGGHSTLISVLTRRNHRQSPISTVSNTGSGRVTVASKTSAITLSKWKTLPKTTKVISFAGTFLFAGLMAVWFAVEPLQSVNQSQKLRVSTDDDDIVYQEFTNVCRIKQNSQIAVGFGGTIAALFTLLFLRAIFLTLRLNKVALPELISDLAIVRALSNVVIITTVAGGAVVLAFFSQNVGTLLIAISAIVLVVCAVNLAILFPVKTLKCNENNLQ